MNLRPAVDTLIVGLLMIGAGLGALLVGLGWGVWWLLRHVTISVS